MINSGLSFMGEVISYMSDYLVGFSFSLVLIKIVRKKRSFNFNKIFVSVIRFLSEISYTLYISHFPLIMLLYASNFRKCQLEFNLLNLFIFVFWVGALVVVATLLWFCFEKRTDRIKSIIVRRIKFLLLYFRWSNLNDESKIKPSCGKNFLYNLCCDLE